MRLRRGILCTSFATEEHVHTLSLYSLTSRTSRLDRMSLSTRWPSTVNSNHSTGSLRLGRCDLADGELLQMRLSLHRDSTRLFKWCGQAAVTRPASGTTLRSLNRTTPTMVLQLAATPEPALSEEE